MSKNKAIFVVALVVIALLAVLAVNGLTLGDLVIPGLINSSASGDTTASKSGIALGLDLVGGSTITFEAEIPAGTSLADASTGMDSAVAMLRERANKQGYTETQITKIGENRVRVDIPNVNDPEEAVKLLGSTAHLTFRDADGNVVIDGSEVQSAQYAVGIVDESSVSKPHVKLTFKPEARVKFAEATKAAAARASESKNYISIFLDEEEQSSPFVDAQYASTGIDSDSCIVSFGNQNAVQSARQFADLVNIGRLPFKLSQVQMSAVGAQLGEQALNTSLIAGLIGLLLVILFMLFVYRLPGLVADIALVSYVSIIILVLSIAGVNLSLPGIAGIILGIGMAVDANVVIFERVKEELRSGKTIRSAVDAGYHRALAAIVDSNLTTLIAAGVLWAMGTGPIQGFAITLFISVIVSMFTALVVTRIMLKSITSFDIKNLNWFGVRKEAKV